MKVGVRKPSVSKRVKARTTGRVKRSVKKAVVPFYGQKGIGYVKNPKKAVYNKIYKKTTIGVDDVVAAGIVAASANEKKKQNHYATNQAAADNRVRVKKAPKGKLKAVGWLLRILGVLFFLVAIIGLLVESNALMLIGIGAGVIAWSYGGNFREVSLNETVSVEVYEEQPDMNIDVDTIMEKETEE